MPEMSLYSISALQQQIKNIVKRGSVHSVQASPPRCRVTFGTDPVNGNQHISDWLLWWAPSDSERTEWNMPAINAPVIVISEGGVLKNGVVYPLGITDNQTPAGSTASEHVIRYSDGAQISYDSSSHTLNYSGVEGGIINVSALGPITINATDITVNADNVNAVIKEKLSASAETATIDVTNSATITAENNISVTANNEVQVSAVKATVSVDSEAIITAQSVSVTAEDTADITAPQVNITAEKTTISGDLAVGGSIGAAGDITDMSSSGGLSLRQLRLIYDAHGHVYDDGTTEPPNQLMQPAPAGFLLPGENDAGDEP